MREGRETLGVTRFPFRPPTPGVATPHPPPMRESRETAGVTTFPFRRPTTGDHPLAKSVAACQTLDGVAHLTKGV
jgi:hypothetical protein